MLNFYVENSYGWKKLRLKLFTKRVIFVSFKGTLSQNNILGQGSKSKSSFHTVIPPILTMLYIMIVDVATPYMYFSIQNPSHFYKKKSQKNMFGKKK